jgi:hypothetical protein
MESPFIWRSSLIGRFRVLVKVILDLSKKIEDSLLWTVGAHVELIAFSLLSLLVYYFKEYWDTEEHGEKALSEALLATGAKIVTPILGLAVDPCKFRVLIEVTFEFVDIGPKFVGVTF